MKPDSVPALVMKTFFIQMTGKILRIAALQRQKVRQRIHIRKVLIGGSDQPALRSSGQRSLKIWRNQPKAGFLDKTDTEAKALAKVNILPQLINKLLFRIVGKKSTAHILATCRGLYHSA